LRSAIGLYPGAWRRRYGDEFEALLEQTPLNARVLFDVAVAAVDAHLNPAGPMRRWPLMFERLRASELAVFAGWVLFVASGLDFSKMTENWNITDPASGTSPAVLLPFLAVMAGAVVALLGVLVAGVPIAWAIARSASKARQWKLLSLFAVPPISLAVWIGLTFLLLNVVVPGPVPDGALRLVGFVAWVGVFCLAAVASTVAVTIAAINGEVAPELYRRAVTPALVVAGTMAAVAIAVVVWGLAVLATEPALFWGYDGLLATSTALSWLGVVAGMGAGAVIALRAAFVARATPLP
jgi:ABC-type spermidine/putrescine transport system permease subunit I